MVALFAHATHHTDGTLRSLSGRYNSDEKMAPTTQEHASLGECYWHARGYLTTRHRHLPRLYESEFLPPSSPRHPLWASYSTGNGPY